MFLEKNSARIEHEFRQLCSRLPGVMEEVEGRIAECPARTALAVKYLYITMPYSDIGNYTFSVFWDYASHSVMLWETYERVRSLPEEIFLNYVLYHRVNEEEIDICRSMFYERVRPELVQSDSAPAGELVQQVNLWCASQVSYRSSDERTASARTVFACGYGRCGEESVFAVNVLRSVGIPARQVYAPRWSHCDDNHAWVEVWLDGEWHFMGACEPYPALDSGWFNGAASRAVLIHSRWFDTVPPRLGNEQVIGREGMTLLLNQTARYAAVRKFGITVTDEAGVSVQDAIVKIQVLNYAGLVTIAGLVTDQNGRASLEMGCGSVHVVVQKGKLRAELQIDGRPENGTEEYRCVLKASGIEKERWINLNMYAPAAERPCRAAVSGGQKEELDRKTARAAEAHREKVRNWRNPECERFLHGDEDTAELRRQMLAVLSEKDQIDLKAEVLEEHLKGALPYLNQVPEDIFVSYIMNPRISDEILTPWRKSIAAAYSAEERERFRRSPASIRDEIRSRISEQPGRERDSIFTTPKAALRLGIASEMSARLLFVAMARSFGIPARLNPQDQEIEYWEAGAFHPAAFAGAREQQAEAKLFLRSENSRITWKYAQNWTLARLRRFRDESKSPEDDAFSAHGNSSAVEETEAWTEKILVLDDSGWENGVFELRLLPGVYRLLTSNRLPNGNQLAGYYDFHICAGQCKTIWLRLREAETSELLGNMRIPDVTLQYAEVEAAAGGDTSVRKTECIPKCMSELAGQEKTLFLWLEEGREPTEHILNELIENRKAFRECGDRIVLILRSERALTDPTLMKCRRAVPGMHVCLHDFGEEAQLLARGVYTEPGQWPLVILAEYREAGLTALYGMSGYHVGMGDMVLRIMNCIT